MKLADIRIDGGTQSREKMNEFTITDYTEAYLNGAVFPPLEVFYDGIDYYLVDGFHRYFMYQRANVKEAEVKILKGTLRDAQFYSLGVNDDHGLRRSNADKRKAVRIALDDLEWQDLSDNQIAKACKVSNTFVANIKKELTIIQAVSKSVKIKGTNTTMDTSNIGKKLWKQAHISKKPEAQDEPEEYDPKDDHIAELSFSNEELRFENEVFKSKEIVLSGDQVKIDEEITGLRKQVKALEAELRAVKNSRDQFQAKNAELINQVNYYKKQLDKIKK